MICELRTIENEYLVLWRVYEVDTGVYLCHTRNRRSPVYSVFGFVEFEFYISYQDGRWVTDPPQPADLVKEVGEAIRAAGYR